MNSPFKNIKENIKDSIKVAVLALVITLGVTYAYASWVGPASTPPDGNVAAPINVGAVDQIKDGGLGVNSLGVFGNGYLDGNLGVGVTANVVKLEIDGEMKIGNTGIDCDEDVEGAMRYNQNDKVIEFCDGDDWKN